MSREGKRYAYPVMLFRRYPKYGFPVSSVVWFLQYGELVQESHFVCRTCDASKCVNSDHLVSVPRSLSFLFNKTKSSVLFMEEHIDERGVLIEDSYVSMVQRSKLSKEDLSCLPK